MADTRLQPQNSKCKVRRHIDRFVAPRPTLEERLAAGKAMRDTLPREQHAAYAPRRGRDDPVRVLELQNATRLQALVPVRHARMLESPFAFLRGAAAVMAADLAPTPTTGAMVQACGDTHVSNFGVYASAERRLVFGINDFDETFPAPWSGTSSAWRPALPLSHAASAARRASPPMRRGTSPSPTASTSASTRAWATSRPGTPPSTRTMCWQPSPTRRAAVARR